MRAVPHKHCNGHHKATGDDDNPKIPAKESARKKCGSQTSGTAEGRWQQHDRDKWYGAYVQPEHNVTCTVVQL